MRKIVHRAARPHPRKARPYHHGDLRRALVDAAFALLTEERNWDFSLREVSRRAGVSHTAAYNHFAEKRDLLAAVAAQGFDLLRTRMLDAIAQVTTADDALMASGHAYVGFAVEKPALYRLMFGPVLATRYADRPEATRAAGAATKAVLEEILLRGARAGLFAIAPMGGRALAAATLACWSAVHGLSMLVIDGEDDAGLPTHDIVEQLIGNLLDGLKPRPADRPLTRAGRR
jgi:AcrR family transcriptional regulator